MFYNTQHRCGAAPYGSLCGMHLVFVCLGRLPAYALPPCLCSWPFDALPLLPAGGIGYELARAGLLGRGQQLEDLEDGELPPGHHIYEAWVAAGAVGDFAEWCRQRRFEELMRRQMAGQRFVIDDDAQPRPMPAAGAAAAAGCPAAPFTGNPERMQRNAEELFAKLCAKKCLQEVAKKLPKEDEKKPWPYDYPGCGLP